jgi:subtilisin family serine protease
MTHEYTFQGRKVALEPDPDFVAVRYREPAPHSMRASVAASAGMHRFEARTEVPGEKFTILPVDPTPEPRAVRQARALSNLRKDPVAVARVAPVFKWGDKRLLATDRILVGFNEAQSEPPGLLAELGPTRLERISDREWLVQLGESDDPLKAASELSERPGVAYAEPDFVTLGTHVPRKNAAQGPGPTDPLSAKQYAMAITHAVEAWQLQTGDPAIRVAILDEGVDTQHEDLASAAVASFDGIDQDAFQEPNPWDGHGTSCAGLAVATQGNQKGIQGVAGGCSLLSVRIAYSEYEGGPWKTSNSVIARSIDWAWQNDADVLSNSWGGGAPSTAIVNAFQRARTLGRKGKGSVVVIAAGNDDGPVSFPGDLADVLTVSASNEWDEPKTKTSQDGETWWGSSYGPEVTLAAPGVHNYTTDISGSAGYNSGGAVDANYVPNFNGTSSATPIVAGACALVLSANPQLTEKQVREVLRDTADKVGSIAYVNGRNDRMGHGRVNVRKAIEAVVQSRSLLSGTIRQLAAPSGLPAAAYVLEGDDLKSYLLRAYEGTESAPWDVLELRNLTLLLPLANRKVQVDYKRRQDTPSGAILWGITATVTDGVVVPAGPASLARASSGAKTEPMRETVPS